jgi:hypothetical protein
LEGARSHHTRSLHGAAEGRSEAAQNVDEEKQSATWKRTVNRQRRTHADETFPRGDILCVCEIMRSMPLCLSSRGEAQNKVFRLSIDGSYLRLLPRTFFCADGKLSVFDVRYVKRTGSPKSIVLPDLDPSWDPTQNQPQLQQQQQQQKQSQHQQNIKSTVKLMDTLDRKIKKTNCSLVHSSKVFQTSTICGTEEGILSLFSAGIWCDVSDRYPDHPQSIDAIEKLTRIQY